MIRLIELFAGIGSQRQALKNIGIECETVGISEIDKYAIKSYEAIHGPTKNFGDICKIDKLPEADLWTYSFPCQDISVAGKLAGIEEGTRSGLLYQVERLLNVANEDGTLPKYLLLENVKNLVSKRFIGDFNKWLDFLSGLGYTNYWKILNAKDYGIPQNRERVFCVSIRGEHNPFNFPRKQELKLKLKDLLEEEVDEKFYLSQKMINCFMSDGTGRYPRRERFLKNINRENQEIGNAVTTLAGNRPTDNFVIDGEYGNKALDETLEQNQVEDGDFIDAFNRNVKKDVAGTITTRVSDSNCTFVAEDRNKKEKLCDDLIENDSVKDGDVVNHSRPKNPVVGSDEVPTITTRGDELGVVVDLKRGYPCKVNPEKEDSNEIDVIGNYSKSGFNQTAIVGKNGIAPTVTENHGQVTAIAIKNNTKKGYLLAEDGDAVDISGRMEWHRGTVQKGMSQTITTAGGDNVGVVLKEKSAYSPLEKELFTEDGDIRRYIGSNKIDKFGEGQMATTNFPNGYGHGTRVHNESVSLTASGTNPSVKYNLRIRKLTSRECLRLMGWDDKSITKIQESGVSQSQQYKQAGNGIVVDVLEAIFRELFIYGRTNYTPLTIYDFGVTD